MSTFRIYRKDNSIKFAGTDSPSFFNDLLAAAKVCDFEAGDAVYEYCTQTHNRLWEVMIDAKWLADELLTKTTRTQ